MTTDKERREVAERLRKLPSTADADGCCTAWDILFALGMKAGDAIGFVPADNAVRLADLINPTCEYVLIGHERFGCSECGHTIRVESDVPVTDEIPMPFRYCPNCGAEVMPPLRGGGGR